MDSVFSTDISKPQINIGKDDKGFNFLMFIIVLIVFVIVTVPWDKLGLQQENMSGGTVAQMFAQDSQDVYLKSNVDKLATGNFNLMFNMPTRQGMNVFQNRGYPLYSILLPDTSMNSTANMKEVSNNYVDNIINKEVYKKEEKMTFSNPVLTLNDLPENEYDSKFKSKSEIKQNILPLIPKETKDYETIGETKSEKSDYLSIPEEKNIKKYVKSTDKYKSVSTIPKNVLPSSLPINAVANSNPYELANVAKITAKTKKTADNLPPLTKWTDENKLFQLYTNRAINQRDCIKDPASCALGSAGGARLNDAFVQSTKNVPYVNLDGNYLYLDSYTGHYYNDNFNTPNINKPYPVILHGDKV